MRRLLATFTADVTTLPGPPGSAGVNVVDLTDVADDELPAGVPRGRYLAVYFEDEDEEAMTTAEWQDYVDAWVPAPPASELVDPLGALVAVLVANGVLTAEEADKALGRTSDDRTDEGDASTRSGR